MPVEKPAKVPKLRTHKATGQGYVVLNGRAVYLGRADQPETERRYHQVIAEWLAAGQQPKVQPADVTVKELLARYWVHARSYHRDAAGQPTTQLHVLRSALKPLRELYAESRAAEFGPLALTAARAGEIVAMRPCDIDMSGRVWTCQPAEHKTVHHGHTRTIYIGPRAQEVLRPFLKRAVGACLFSPAEAMAERREQRHKQRTTRLSCGNRRRDDEARRVLGSYVERITLWPSTKRGEMALHPDCWSLWRSLDPGKQHDRPERRSCGNEVAGARRIPLQLREMFWERFPSAA